MKKLLVLALTSAFAFSTLVACSDEPQTQPSQQQAQLPPVQQPIQQAPVQTQPQVVVVDNGNSNDGLSAGEAMLVGAAAGALAGNLTSNNSRDTHHYYNNSNSGYSNNTYPTNKSYYSNNSSQAYTNKTYKKAPDRTILPSMSNLSNVNKSSSSKPTSVRSTSSNRKPISFDLNKPSLSASSSSKSFKSSGTGFKSSSSRR